MREMEVLRMTRGLYKGQMVVPSLRGGAGFGEYETTVLGRLSWQGL